MSRRCPRGARAPRPGARVLALVLLVPALLAPATAAAQPATSIGPYAAYPLSTAPADAPAGWLVGLQAALASGPIAARAGAGMRVPRADDASTGAGGGWAADGDLLVLPQALGRRSGATPMVYGLAGVGIATPRRDVPTSASWSYGAGLLVPLGALELTAETRARTPFDGGTRWHEGRVGVALRFGGAGRGIGRGASRAGGGRLPMPGRAPTGGAAGGAADGAGASASARRVLSTADRYVGVPYRWGGTSPTGGFDCSGFVQYVYAQHAVQLPRTSRQQAHAGAELRPSWNAVAPGDLVMFAEPGEAISHVAIYVGQRRIIHASSSGGGVRYDDLDTRRGQWYLQRMVAARRVTDGGPAIARGLLERLGLTNAPLDPPDRAPRP